MSDDFCPRQITFELAGSPGVMVTATENGGAIDFIVDVEDTPTNTADLRGLFFHFNEAKLSGLQITNTDSLITESQIKANSVINLHGGANMQGAVKSGFDIGLEFGTPGGGKDDLYSPVHFTLSRAAGDLTLDDFASLQFGARLDSLGGGAGGRAGGATKLLGTAPWAPDARDDNLSVFEDGASGLNDPSKTPKAVALNVLGNDVDGDGQALTITAFHDGPSHGTVEISADGKTVLYTPDLDYSGTDSFEYCVTDGNGGQDHAVCNITVEAVADRPDITYTVEQGASINELLVNVTANQADADSSEFLHSLVASGAPAGVTVTPLSVTPGGELDTIVQQFKVVAPEHQDTKFDLALTATSQETSNGDTEQFVQTVPIEIDFTHNEAAKTFITQDQSIWDSGAAFTYDKSQFLGVNIPFDIEVPFFIPPDPIPFIGFAEGHLKSGFQTTLHFEAGGIDVAIDMLIVTDTTYNKTTDTLFIEPSAVLQGGSFTTTGPEGSFKLDFVFDFAINGGVEFPVDISDSFSTNQTLNLIDLNSHSPDLPYTVPILPGIVDISFDWPHLATTSTPGTLTSEGASNNFLDVNLDVDALAITLFPLLAPIDPNLADPDNFELLDLDVNAGINLLQKFVVNVLGMKSTDFVLEDGSTVPVTFGTPLTVTDVSAHDANNDGGVGFDVSLTPDATLKNETSVGFNIGGSIVILKNIPIIDTNLWGDSINIPIADATVFDSTFGIQGFQSQDFSFAV